MIVARGSYRCVVRLKGGLLVRRSFAVAGHVTGFGSRLWLSTHPPETRTAPVLTRLVDNGAVLLGKTIMAEFGYRYSARGCFCSS
jgi:Asp-tRNA(Asn)/Glu-tRNA(Gln) amidotransferase A subunit family amidase